jgi:hypothetical protein
MSANTTATATIRPLLALKGFEEVGSISLCISR